MHQKMAPCTQYAWHDEGIVPVDAFGMIQRLVMIIYATSTATSTEERMLIFLLVEQVGPHMKEHFMKRHG